MKGLRCPIVGIGSSAGGLNVLKNLFQSLPANTGAAFVIIQHLDPKHKSLTAEILGRLTAMPTMPAEEGMLVEANHIYVIPSNCYLTLNENIFVLKEPVLQHGLRMPIDMFFLSLAQESELRAVAIIISGTGSDGAIGLRSIKACGGLILAQSPETAQFDGMPRNAIATGMVDIVCPVEDMPKSLSQYLQHPYVIDDTKDDESDSVTGDEIEQLNNILAFIRVHSGRDFRGYKHGTLKRRITRRMGLHHIDTLKNYLTFLRQQDDEASRLSQDMLVSVTAFFRDSQAFDTLNKKVIIPLVARKRSDDLIRVWVPGCATGEEAYSIAMLLIEELEKANKHCPIQIFASDLDETALSVGRAGLFSENTITNLTPKRLQRFFTREDHNYLVDRILRETITFASQNIINDPPFSNLDIISCRNVLIYFNTELQHQVLALFHFALNNEGYLFLGHSETTSQNDDLFELLDKKWRIHKRNAVIKPIGLRLPTRSRIPNPTALKYSTESVIPEQVRFNEVVQYYLLQEYAPAAVLVNNKDQVVYFSGSTTRFLQQPSGHPTQDLLTLAPTELRIRLRIALRRVTQQKDATVIENWNLLSDGKRVDIKLTFKQLPIPHVVSPLVLITFEERALPQQPSEISQPKISGSEKSLIQQMEEELNVAREDLQANIEAFEVANEELQAANEEVMSVNEELQSTNEELETSKEELQSTNEELTTVNNELKDKIEELAKINDDLENLLGSTEIATLFIDADFNIRRFTSATKKLFKLIPSDIGRKLTDIRSVFIDDHLLDDCMLVLVDHKLTEREIETEHGEFYLRRILPFHTRDHQIEGVVVAFIDISERRLREEQANRLAAVVRDSNDAVTVLDLEGNILNWNRGAHRMYGWSEKEALGMPINAIIPPNGYESITQLIEQVSNGDTVSSFETKRITKNGDELDVQITITSLVDSEQNVFAIATTERDVTQRNINENILLEHESIFRVLIESALDALVIVNPAGEIIQVNTETERLFGYKLNEILGLSIEMLIPEHLRSSHVELRKRYFSNPIAREMGIGVSLFAVTKSGDQFPVEIRLSPITTANGVMMCASIRDIRIRKKTEEDLRIAMNTAENALATKSRFLATASHDLRQPLQSLNLLNKALMKSVEGENIQTMLAMQLESLNGMGRLLNSLLDISKLESGTVKAEITNIYLQPILDRLRDEFDSVAREKGLQFYIDTSDATVKSDASLLAQVIHNLVANAIRYTKEGSVELRCVYEQSCLRIEVRDSGIGISPDKMDLVFEEFQQVNRDPQERQSGLGLGLSIVQHIANLLDVKVQAQSQLGQGSLFTVTVPLGTSKLVVVNEVNPLDTLDEICTGSILLIDDDTAVLDASATLLALETNFDIAVASSVSQAYSMLKEKPPNLILTDFHLGDEQTGIDFIHMARKHLGYQIPAILVTGDTSTILDEFKIDCVRILTKPVDADELISVTRQLLFEVQKKPASQI